MAEEKDLLSIVLEGANLEDFLIHFQNGMGIKEIHQGNKKLYERESSYAFIELDSKLGT